MYSNHFGTPSPLFRLLPEFPSHFQSSKSREDNHNSRHAVCGSWHKLDEVIVDCVPTLLFLPLIIVLNIARVGLTHFHSTLILPLGIGCRGFLNAVAIISNTDENLCRRHFSVGDIVVPFLGRFLWIHSPLVDPLLGRINKRFQLCPEYLESSRFFYKFLKL
jgi:hypothetical protein